MWDGTQIHFTVAQFSNYFVLIVSTIKTTQARRLVARRAADLATVMRRKLRMVKQGEMRENRRIWCSAVTCSVFVEAVHRFAYDYLNEIRIYKTEIEREQALLQNLVSCLCLQHFYLTEKIKIKWCHYLLVLFQTHMLLYVCYGKQHRHFWRIVTQILPFKNNLNENE